MTNVALSTASSLSLLPLPATAAAYGAAPSDMSNLLLLLMIVAMLGIAVFLTLSLRRYNDILNEQVQGANDSRPAGSEADDLHLLMQDTVEQLKDIATLLHTSTSTSSNAQDANPPARALARPAAEDGSAAVQYPALPAEREQRDARENTLQDISATLAERASQTDRLTLSVALEVARGGLGSTGTAGEIRRLAEYDRHTQEIGEVARNCASLAERTGNLLGAAPAGMSATTAGEPPPASRQAPRYLVFSLDGEPFAVDSLSVKEILLAGALAFEPDMPPGICAVVELPCARVPVIDLGGGGRRRGIDADTRIVVLAVSHAGRQYPLGVLVDAVHEIAPLRLLDHAPPATLAAHVRRNFIQSLGQVEGRLVALLDIGQGLAPDELAAIAALGQLTAQEETGA